ncbi:lipase family protein [Chitinophaga agrisoli]|uniref:Lipase family protein n=1 Tax=Chitinophaga agrisoli TaxID=2607653 RepID=A0A5B2VWR5_9BACT|nr:lipase family protein [Chitinophaga agrisoli]KAA2242752.1 lipase family protein [Chitinophaga agrisoli]
MESQVTSLSISLSEAIQTAKIVNLAEIMFKQALKQKDKPSQLNPSLQAYQNICNNPDFQALVDKDFMTNYNVLYNIQMNDIIAQGGLPDLVYYGFIAQHKSTLDYVMAIRGTQNILEVIADAFLIPTTFKEFNNNAMVPSGFYDLYESALIVSPPDASKQIVPLLLKIVAADPALMMPDARNVRTTVAGHSLGATLATYYAAAASSGLGKGLDLTVCTYASPMTGDATFANTYNNQVADNTRIYNVPDVVPKVPEYFENGVNIYTQVAGGYKIDSTPYPQVKPGAPCAHQLPVYEYVLERLNGTDNPAILNFDGGGCKATS